MDHQIRHTQEMREGLLLYTADAPLERIKLFWGLRCRPHVFVSPGEEPARAAGWIKYALPKSGIDHLHRELRCGSRRVELARVAGTLQILKDLLVNVAERMADPRLIEVNVIVDLVDDLPHQRAGFHVVVG